MEDKIKIVADLIKELEAKHSKDEGCLYLSLQDGVILVCEQEYDNMKILEELPIH